MSMSKQHYAVAVVAIVALALLNGVTLYYAFSRAMSPATVGKDEAQSNIISVSGTGSAYASPDVAYVSVAVMTQAATATEAQQKNAVTMNSVIEALKSIGVTQEELATEQYSLRPLYDYDKQQRMVGYECRNSLRVTWKKVYEVGIVLDAAVKAGANSVGSVTFGLSKQKVDSLMGEAIKQAVSDADAKAQALASSLKLTIVGKASASIGTQYAPRAVSYELRTDSTPILPTELYVTVTVNVDYRFA